VSWISEETKQTTHTHTLPLKTVLSWKTKKNFAKISNLRGKNKHWLPYEEKNCIIYLILKDTWIGLHGEKMCGEATSNGGGALQASWYFIRRKKQVSNY
jgi:hypothetical protein